MTKSELNRAVAIGFRDGPATGLTALEPLLREPALAISAEPREVQEVVQYLVEAGDQAQVALPFV